MALEEKNVLVTFLRVCESLERRMPRGYNLEVLARSLPRLGRAVRQQDEELRQGWNSLEAGLLSTCEFAELLAAWARAQLNAFRGWQSLAS